MSLCETDFRKIMGSFTTGVALATTQHKGKAVGVIINTLTSVSLAPPLILFCLGKRRVVFPAFLESAHYAIHILSSQQKNLCGIFAHPMSHPWEGVPHTMSKNGCPIIANSLGILHCRREQTYEGGDHLIFLSAVEDIHLDKDACEKEPLVYFQGSFQ